MGIYWGREIDLIRGHDAGIGVIAMAEWGVTRFEGRESFFFQKSFPWRLKKKNNVKVNQIVMIPFPLSIHILFHMASRACR